MRVGVLACCLAVAGCPDEDGRSWQVVHEDLDGALLSVWGTSASDVWAVGGDVGDGMGPLVIHFDGTSWVESWDGSTIGADGKTPVGPPRAIEVTLTLRHAGTQGGEAKEKTFVHVVAVAAANAQPTEAGASSTGGTTGGSP